ncbi:glyoxalase family protein [Abditibacterium utsteinense]|uniref:Glyoxalase family protein n=1 Tax=Abditibacterium utsteinense TaxID=1960156 RepID=A0A2S8ST87_9BACT|nr:VOC family protein [Abditibacterium utsteinense]PQV64010.1 glyoxalase family protein [Abditibacterium utsteinense]
MDNFPGLHHVTAICSDAQQNLDFYCGVLGLRLVKLTVNFDDPFAYHLYYGDELGRPGTILTFFAWSGAQQAVHGNKAVASTAFAVPLGALGWWKEYLATKNVAFTSPPARFGEDLIQFHDADGLVLELVESSRASEGFAWENGPIPTLYAIRGLHSVTIAAEATAHTAALLSGALGFKALENPSLLEANRFRFEGGSGIGSIVDIACLPDAPRATTGVGSVHHVAFRTSGDAEQKRLHVLLERENLNVSPVMDRSYFRSIYFREPGGILFEIATDVPGFTVDENAENLGANLQLPTQLEPYRAQIEAHVVEIQWPKF